MGPGVCACLPLVVAGHAPLAQRRRTCWLAVGSGQQAGAQHASPLKPHTACTHLEMPIMQYTSTLESGSWLVRSAHMASAHGVALEGQWQRRLCAGTHTLLGVAGHKTCTTAPA